MPISTYSSRFTDEVVDDSEPEREQLRAQSKSAQQRLKKLGHQTGQLTQVGETVTTLIEISDSESSSEESTPSLPPSSFPETSEPGGTNPTFSLGHFAYPAVPPMKRSTTLQTTDNQSSAPKKPTPYQRPPVRKNSPSNLQLADVNKVSRCVCCHVSWTSRKTAVQKLNHIQSCSKKHCYDDDTIRILVDKAVASSSPPKPKANGKNATPVSTTYLEDLVRDKAPKKRTKSKASDTLITAVENNRSIILARANDIFTSMTPDESLRADQYLAPSTQSFATSSLGGLQGFESKRLLFDDDEASSPTQAFLGNRLGLRTPRSLFDLGDDEDDELTPSSSTSRPNKSRSCSPLAFGPVHRHATVASYSRDVAEPPPDSESELDEPLFQVDTTQRGRPCKSYISSDSNSIVDMPKKGRGRSLSKKTPKSKRVVFGDEWEFYMKQYIIEDDELHLRILRAEPLDFNSFWEIAKRYSPNASTSKLKTELRNFLDNQAILFYESTAWRAKSKAKS
ncbi:hypothetical protein CPB83DRAFT_831324 [Crepidotus variabilis]|uniref:Uncharacterized protein n=1 Tax=Crepidotus variabilis TaxID=179855 RepID=A0A9P6JVS4_9AGAR|nr:hypothetical protein CPB83DRAFT_831324 [Crepidotus variabilis]